MTGQTFCPVAEKEPREGLRKMKCSAVVMKDDLSLSANYCTSGGFHLLRRK